MKTKITNEQKYENYKNIYENFDRAYNNKSFYECVMFEYAILEDCTSRILAHLGIVCINDRTKYENSYAIKEYVDELLKTKSTNIRNILVKINLIKAIINSINCTNNDSDIIKIFSEEISTIKHLDEIKDILDSKLPIWVSQRNKIVHNLCNENIASFNKEIEDLVIQGKKYISLLDGFDKAIKTRKIRDKLTKSNIITGLVIENNKIKISDDIFYRLIDDSTIVYQTSKQKIYKMTPMAFYILDFYKKSIKSSIVKYISSIQSITLKEEDIFDLNDFVNSLIENEILFIPYEQDRPNQTEIDLMEKVSAKNHLLYKAMFELTYRCNERCVHCYCVTDKSEGELSTQKIKSLIDELRDMNAMEITFTGGDLFVRKDTFEILEYAYSKNFLINIFTNGLALKDDDLFRLQKIHPRSISLSLYDVIPEKHDAFTTIKGSFNKTTSVIRKLRALGIKVNVKTNVREDNLSRLKEFVEMVKDMDANLEVSLSFTPRNDGNMDPTRFRVNSIEKYQQALKTIFPYLTEESSIKIDKNVVDRKICWAGEDGISINPYGQVYACNALLIQIGDVNKQSIKEIWENSDELKRIRKFNMNMVSCASKCKYAQFCAFCPGTALTETHNPLHCYDEACNITKAQIGLRKE